MYAMVSLLTASVNIQQYSASNCNVICGQVARVVKNGVSFANSCRKNHKITGGNSRFYVNFRLMKK